MVFSAGAAEFKVKGAGLKWPVSAQKNDLFCNVFIYFIFFGGGTQSIQCGPLMHITENVAVDLAR